MGRTLLIASPRHTWREWLKAHREGRDLICLDPTDPQQGIPGRMALFQGEYSTASRFYGSLDAQRSPHVTIAAVARLLEQASEDCLVQLFAYRPTPTLHQTAMIVADLVRPSQILIAENTALELGAWNDIVEPVELPDAVSAQVQHAQRKAQWLRLIEECESHEVDMKETTVEGARLGSGEFLDREERERAGLKQAVYAEKCGGNLLIVSQAEPDEAEVGRALDVTGCGRATFVEPDAYENLVCSFARTDGEEIGMGLIQKVDWTDRRLYIQCTAVAPIRVPILRIGSIRVDLDGRELGETRPWQV